MKPFHLVAFDIREVQCDYVRGACVQSVFSRKVKATTRTAPQQMVVPIQPNGTGIPLFLVSPGIESLSFVRYLGPDQPVFAIRVPNLMRSMSLEDLAAVLAENVREVHPSGA